MNALILSFFAVLAVTHAGLHGGAFIGAGVHGGAIHGPGSHTAVVGPDGSHISAAAAGGAVAVGPAHGGAVSAAVVPGHIGLGLGGIGHAGGLIGAGAGHGGHYIPSGLERLYDDGSYRLEHHLEGLHHGILHH